MKCDSIKKAFVLIWSFGVGVVTSNPCCLGASWYRSSGYSPAGPCSRSRVPRKTHKRQTLHGYINVPHVGYFLRADL